MTTKQCNPGEYAGRAGELPQNSISPFERDNLHSEFWVESIMRLVVARYVLLTSLVRGSTPRIITRLTRMSDRACNHDDRQRCRTEQEDRADAEPYREVA